MKSKKMLDFFSLYTESKTPEDRNKLWAQVVTPFVESFDDDGEQSLVTFVYRLSEEEVINQTKIFLHSTVVELPLSKKYRLQPVKDTDLCVLSLNFPNQLRTTYNFIRIDNTVVFPAVTQMIPVDDMPVETGDFALQNRKIAYLYENKKVDIDGKNPNAISYPIDFENPQEVFATESILELPFAPKQEYFLSSPETIKKQRDNLKKENRFQQYQLVGKEQSEEFFHERKYWVYLPPDYSVEAEKYYPLILFLDGSTYVDTVPCLSIIEAMIQDEIIPPCVAVFFDYSMTDRWREYYCNERFTRFISEDFLRLLKTKYHLRILDDPKQCTIVGSSAGGLAAFYAGLTRPHIFGNIIAQSASFEAKKARDLETLIDKYAGNNRESLFLIEIGIYEKFPIELLFSDREKQVRSSYQANQGVVEQFKHKKINVEYHEFVGGHSYVCYRVALQEALKSLFQHRQPKPRRIAALL